MLGTLLADYGLRTRHPLHCDDHQYRCLEAGVVADLLGIHLHCLPSGSPYLEWAWPVWPQPEPRLLRWPAGDGQLGRISRFAAADQPSSQEIVDQTGIGCLRGQLFDAALEIEFSGRPTALPCCEDSP